MSFSSCSYGQQEMELALKERVAAGGICLDIKLLTEADRWSPRDGIPKAIPKQDDVPRPCAVRAETPGSVMPDQGPLWAQQITHRPEEWQWQGGG